jgi:Tfp pilus assembly protein PilN
MSTVNLLPDDYVLKRAQKRANVLIAVLFVAVMAAVVGAVVASKQSNKHTQEARDRVNKAYEEAAKLVSQVQQLEIKRSAMLTKAEHSALLVEKVPRSYLLAMIANALPPAASITKLQLETKELDNKVDQFAISPKGIRKGAPQGLSAKMPERLLYRMEARITGLTATDVDVAKLIANLARNPSVDSVDLVYSQEKVIDKLAIREFQINVVLKTSADTLQEQTDSRKDLLTSKTAAPGLKGTVKP